MPEPTRFTNELGNTISVVVEQKEIEGIDGIYIAIAGPASEATLHITRKEAVVLSQQLVKTLSYGGI